MAHAAKELVASDSSGASVELSEAEQFITRIEGEDYYRLRAADLPSGKYSEIRRVKGIKTLVFDPENIPTDALLEARSAFEETYEHLDGFALEGSGSIAAAVKRDKEELYEVYDFFEYKIPRKYLPVLEDALTLRVIDRKEDITGGQRYDWRGEIAANYKPNDPQNAQSLLSLCSAGYLDEGAVFQSLYRERVERGEWSEDRYRRVFDTYIKHKPFVVFVESTGMTTSEVRSILSHKTSSIDRFPGGLDFVDICGRGEEAVKTVNKTHKEIRTNNPDLKARKIDYGESKQQIVRIQADTL